VFTQIRFILLFTIISASLFTACASPAPQPVLLPSEAGEDGDEISMQAGVALPKAAQADLPAAQLQAETTPPGVGGAAQPTPAGLEGGTEPQPGAGQPPVVQAAPALAAPPADLPVGPEVGNLAPEFSLQTPDGQTISLSSLRGRPLVVSYWASWCGPCKNEMQILQGVFEQYQAQGFTVLAVNAIEQDNLNEVTSLVSALGLTYPIVLDQGDQFADRYNALFLPTSYFVDVYGVIQDISLGDSPADEFQARVQRFLESQ
jgi:peroxiredoxin